MCDVNPEVTIRNLLINYDSYSLRISRNLYFSLALQESLIPFFLILIFTAVDSLRASIIMTIYESRQLTRVKRDAAA
jgi:hypothetical protein